MPYQSKIWPRFEPAMGQIEICGCRTDSLPIEIFIFASRQCCCQQRRGQAPGGEKLTFAAPPVMYLDTRSLDTLSVHDSTYNILSCLFWCVRPNPPASLFVSAHGLSLILSPSFSNQLTTRLTNYCISVSKSHFKSVRPHKAPI
jgi:hypothetical protein